MHELDVAMTHAINALAGRFAAVDLLMTWSSAAGVPLLVLIVASQWWRRAQRQRTRHVLVASGLSFLLGLFINQAVLFFIHRMRPYDAGVTHLLIAPSPDFSFPSDHATATFAVAATFLAHRMAWPGGWLLAAAVLVSLSRVYLGTHYLSDVLGGACTGIIAAVVIRAAYREDTALDRTLTGLL